MNLKRTLVAAALLAWLPLSSHAEDGVAQDLSRQLAAFQQKLDTAYAEAKQEEARLEAEFQAWVAEQRAKGIIVQGGGVDPAVRLRANVEQKMEPEKMALKVHIENFFGMCVDEIAFGFDPLPFFSMKLRSKPSGEEC